MNSSNAFIGSGMFWLLLLALIVIAVVGVRFVRARRTVAPPPPEIYTGPAEASFLDSSHIGGPIAGTEQYPRFNPDTATRKSPGPAGS